MIDIRDYDRNLRMFREPPRPIDMARLRFLRWLAEQGRLEHPPAGPASGELLALAGESSRTAQPPAGGAAIMRCVHSGTEEKW